MAMSLRLDAETEAQILRLAKSTGRSKSAIVRDALADYAAAHIKEVQHRSAFDRLRPYIGVFSSGGANYSTDTHEKYRAALIEKHRGRRSR